MMCAHETCTCPIDDPGLRYCGPSCRMGIEDPTGQGTCYCGHAECDNSEGEG